MGNAGETVTVEFAGQRKTTKVPKSGKWRVDLDPLPACSEGRDLAVFCVGEGADATSSDRVSLSDVLVGEVWLCAGQSNCEVPLVGEQVHFRDEQGGMTAQLTRKPNIRYVIGILTMVGERGIRLRFGIPNDCVRQQLFGYLHDYYMNCPGVGSDGLDDLYDAFATAGDWEPLLRHLAGNYAKTTPIRGAIDGEIRIQGYMQAEFTHIGLYLVKPEMELGRGYSDFCLFPDRSRHGAFGGYAPPLHPLSVQGHGTHSARRVRPVNRQKASVQQIEWKLPVVMQKHAVCVFRPIFLSSPALSLSL